MKAVILAGGLGTRFAEETDTKPKPMIEVGGKPIIWHVMRIYSAHEINDFIICLGYKGYVIKEYFQNYFVHMSNVAFDVKRNSMEVHDAAAEPWRVTLIDTGEKTMIGGRIKRILPYLGDDKEFCLTYGDGVGDINVQAAVDLHRKEGRLATVTATQPPGRFGAINYQGNRVTGFQEKPMGDGGWINGGFFVLSPQVGRYIKDDATVWSRSRCRSSPRRTSSASISIMASGSRWIHCATSASSKIYGRPARRLGKHGE
jgi:glucose-1-phosphate cytidylyltransferase